MSMLILRGLLALATIGVVAAQDMRPLRPANEPEHPSNGILEISLSHSFPGEAEVRQRAGGSAGWRGGVIAVTMRNVSRGEDVVILDSDAMAQYEIEVWDVGGNPVPLTPAGEANQKGRRDRLGFATNRETKTLAPGEAFTIRLNVSILFQIKPDNVYRVRVRRSDGLPDHDRAGNKIAAELSQYWSIAGNEDR